MFVKSSGPQPAFVTAREGKGGAIQGEHGQNVAGGTKSLGRGKGCLRLHFERFDKNGYFVKFYNFKSHFFAGRGGGGRD